MTGHLGEKPLCLPGHMLRNLTCGFQFRDSTGAARCPELKTARLCSGSRGDNVPKVACPMQGSSMLVPLDTSIEASRLEPS